MTLKQMQYFISLCQTLNMTRSAKSLFVSQPTLSVAMKDLENEVGVPLFRKEGTHLSLTEAGARLAREIRGILEKYNDIETMIRSGDLQRNCVRFGFSSVVGSSAAPLICRQFLNDQPDIRLSIVEGIGRDLLSMLDNGQLDVVLTGKNYHLDGPFAEKFSVLELAPEPMVFCVSADSPLAAMSSISPEEIAREPVIMFKESIPVASMLEKQFSDWGIPLNIIFRTSQLFTVERFIAFGVAGGFLPAMSCQDNLSVVPIRCKELEELTKSPVAMFWKKRDSVISGLIRSAQKAASRHSNDF